MNRYYYSRPIFEKFENIKENIKSNNIIFLGTLEFLDSGRKCWTLESGLWALDAGLWALGSGHFCWQGNPVSASAWSNYWKFFGYDSLRTSWSHLFYREYVRNQLKKFLLWEIGLDQKKLSWTFRSSRPELRKFLKKTPLTESF